MKKPTQSRPGKNTATKKTTAPQKHEVKVQPRASGARAVSPGKKTAAKKTTVPIKHEIKVQHRVSDAQQVFIAGTFNDWNPTSHPLKADRNGTWDATLKLDRNDHEYKFVVDGEWCHDEVNPNYVINPFGTRNSIFQGA